MEMREIAVKVLFEGHEPHAVIFKNGSLKFYRLETISYEEVDELFDARASSSIEK